MEQDLAKSLVELIDQTIAEIEELKKSDRFHAAEIKIEGPGEGIAGKDPQGTLGKEEEEAAEKKKKEEEAKKAEEMEKGILDETEKVKKDEDEEDEGEEEDEDKDDEGDEKKADVKGALENNVGSRGKLARRLQRIGAWVTGAEEHTH